MAVEKKRREQVAKATSGAGRGVLGAGSPVFLFDRKCQQSKGTVWLLGVWEPGSMSKAPVLQVFLGCPGF